jgi:hypothetical protein
MPSEVARDATPGEITPRTGKGPLGTWRALAGPGHRAGVAESIVVGLHSQSKPLWRGGDTGQRLTFLHGGKAVRTQARARTGLGKSDRPGS